jgi:hypothetical protein
VVFVGVGVADGAAPVFVGVGVADGAAPVFVGVAVAVEVAAVPVAVGVDDGVDVVGGAAPLRTMTGLPHMARSPIGEPYEDIYRMNFTSCPASLSRLISGYVKSLGLVRRSHFSLNLQMVVAGPEPI